ncbi:pentapeptide repeat-containing protein [Cryobacterium melibiosiphilum]|uniref:Pentapeptide repeat-containing protein n=1 Tax=Cryobacterium melibiosiphilum TaxID=995039 RepID=A0A3A5MGU8_9MICO|nr:pentapeptide repeat-containing protein [Cryobacterium melibiosiphilum]RJT88335.1 pentapeptide repeat-containing protein [Cryobacterium melibiosiphilum]
MARPRPTTGIRSPLIDPIRLHGITDSDGAALGRGDGCEALRFTGVSLGERDLTGATFEECEFVGVDLHDAALRGITVSESIFTDLHAPVFSAPRSTWRDVRLDHARIGSMEAYEATLRSVHIDGSKLDFVNLRNATLTDVLLSNCIIDELDLGSATLQRVELQNCRIGTLDVTGARCTDVDLRSSEFSAIHGLEGLRGATIDDAQLALLAPLLAAHLGIRVE